MNTDFFQRNRNDLIRCLNGAVVSVAAYGRLQRSNDAAHRFSQESNFWYLCGITEPDWQLLIDGTSAKSYLIMPDVSETHRIFDGGMSAEAAKSISGVDRVLSADEGLAMLRDLAKKHSLVHTVGAPPHAEYFNFTLNPSITKHQQMLDRIFNRVQDCHKDLAGMRAIKQPEEIAAMQRAIDVTVEGFTKVRADMKRFRYEYEIEAALSFHFRGRGATGHAYDPIIAAGKNACTLHYGQNHDKLTARQLILMDVGAEVNGYAADITRTYAYGNPTKRQAAVHAALREAHHTIVELIEPLLAVDEYQHRVDEIMTEALRKLGLYDNEESLRRYFPHAVSHGLGIDVHDSLGAPRQLQQNMVLTVEPGIYIPEEGIGVRIEDDILVTANGHKNLSGKLSTEL